MKKYGYQVWDEVVTLVPIKNEYDQLIPAGTLLRIVAIAPKVRITTGDSRWMDNKQHFYNAVLSTQAEDWGNRIRADFVTIKKIKP